MMRFEIYLNIYDKFKDFDYIFSVDADLEAVGDISASQIISDLTACRHPGYPAPGPARSLPYDHHENSAAYIADDESGNYYFGAFWGGKVSFVTNMLKTIKRRVKADLKNNIIPSWHDESHLNRYLLDLPPAISLDAGFVTAEGNNVGNTKIIQLNKDHTKMRDCDGPQSVCPIN